MRWWGWCPFCTRPTPTRSVGI